MDKTSFTAWATAHGYCASAFAPANALQKTMPAATEQGLPHEVRFITLATKVTRETRIGRGGLWQKSWSAPYAALSVTDEGKLVR